MIPDYIINDFVNAVGDTLEILSDIKYREGVVDLLSSIDIPQLVQAHESDKDLYKGILEFIAKPHRQKNPKEREAYFKCRKSIDRLNALYQRIIDSKTNQPLSNHEYNECVELVQSLTDDILKSPYYAAWASDMRVIVTRELIALSEIKE